MSQKKLVALGRIEKPHGLKGELSIASYADSPSVFGELSQVYLKLGDRSPKPYHIIHWRMNHQRVLLTIEGIDDRTAAEAWRKALILVDYDELSIGQSGEIFWEDLIGREVFLKDTSRLGRLTDIQDNGGHEVWTISTDAGEDVLFPAVDEFVIQCEKAKQTVIIDPPPGLIELYRTNDKDH